nr:hypothetical protein MACL_00002288 [Theileria orientalis]
MNNHPEVVRKQSSESVGLLGTKIVTELCELTKAVQEDETLLKYEITECRSQSDISQTQSVQDQEETSLKKQVEYKEEGNEDQEEEETVSYTEVKSISEVEIRNRVLTRGETFGASSEKTEEEQGSRSWISEESHAQGEEGALEEEKYEDAQGEELYSPVVVVDERCLILKGYESNYASGESTHSKSSLNTTKNMQLLRKSPFSTRNGSEISRGSSESKKEGSSKVVSVKGSDILTESDWKEVTSKEQSYEKSTKGTSTPDRLRGSKESGLEDSDTPKSQKEYQVAYREFSRGYKAKNAAKSSSESYKLMRRNAMELDDSPRERESEEKRLVQRYLVDGEDERAVMYYDKIEDNQEESGDKEKERGEGTKGKSEVIKTVRPIKAIKGYSGSRSGIRELEKRGNECSIRELSRSGEREMSGSGIRELSRSGIRELSRSGIREISKSGIREIKREVSGTTLAEYEDEDKEDEKKRKHVTQNNIGVSLIVKRKPKSKKLRGGVKAMDKFNGFFSIMRAGMVKHTMVLATVFWLVSFWCLYPSMFTGWLKNEITYKKGDIKGSSVTLIGLNKINRYDAAYLKDGALLTLSRKVTFEEILNDEDPLENYEEFTATVTRLTPAKVKVTTTVAAPKEVVETMKRGPEENSDNEDEYEGEDYKLGMVKGGARTSFMETEARESKEGGKEYTDKRYKEGEWESEATRRDSDNTNKDNNSIINNNNNNQDNSNKDKNKGEEKQITKSNIRGTNEVVERVNMSLDIYRHCPYERNFIKKSCCFRDMCEVGNLDEKDTKYFKSLYGATVYDIHYSEFKNLQKGGNIAMSTGLLSMFFSCMVIMITLSRLGAFPHEKLKEAAFNLGIVAWVISIFLSLLGFLLWNHYTGGAVCVDEGGRSKPCNLHTGSILFILHIIFEGVGLILEIVNSVLLKPKELVINAEA